ncbi:hypothetical protein MK805_16155 [Shimazuella sp. AN120528]|uniref:hypothetical protein n=1 Tax=Shimazuella soli TaxID=1892854 RepID=UPI001F10F3B0|nr:hypothetical protein [Shimazuella soli]MCH5586474.1 hypothetical protein [Shimazuella soli]
MAATNACQPVKPAIEATIHIEWVSGIKRWIPGTKRCKVVIGEMRLTGTLPKNTSMDSSNKEAFINVQIDCAKRNYWELVRNVKRMLHNLPVLDELELGKSIDDVLGFELEDPASIPADQYEAALMEAEAPIWEAVVSGNALSIDVPVTKLMAEAAVAYFKEELATTVQFPINGSVWETWAKYVREHPGTYAA